MQTWRVVLYLLLIWAGWLLPATSADKTAWSVYHAATFDVSYPAAFTVKPSLKSPLCPRRDGSIFFVSPDGKVQFYATMLDEKFATDVAMKPATEILAATKTSIEYGNHWNTGERCETGRFTWKTIKAKDGSYTRALLIVVDSMDGMHESPRYILGVQFTTDAAYRLYRDAYVKFKASLHERLYKGDSFGVIIPPDFVGRPSLRAGNSKDGSVLSAFITLPEKKTEFYVFAPWTDPMTSPEYQLQPKTEIQVSSKTADEKILWADDTYTVTRKTIKAKDGSYTRLVIDIDEKFAPPGTITLGFKYRDEKTYEAYADDWLIMQKTLMLYHWD